MPDRAIGKPKARCPTVWLLTQWLISNFGTDSERMTRAGETTVLIDQIEQPIGKVNFVLRDSKHLA